MKKSPKNEKKNRKKSLKKLKIFDETFLKNKRRQNLKNCRINEVKNEQVPGQFHECKFPNGEITDQKKTDYFSNE